MALPLSFANATRMPSPEEQALMEIQALLQTQGRPGPVEATEPEVELSQSRQDPLGIAPEPSRAPAQEVPIEEAREPAAVKEPNLDVLTKVKAALGAQGKGDYSSTSQAINLLNPEQIRIMRRNVVGGPAEGLPLSEGYLPASEGMPEFRAQEQGLKDLQELLKAQAGISPQLDLTPLMQAADAWSGSNLTAGYKRPMGPEERGVQAISQSNVLQQRRKELTDQLAELMRMQKAGYDMEKLAAGFSPARALGSGAGGKRPTLENLWGVFTKMPGNSDMIKLIKKEPTTLSLLTQPYKPATQIAIRQLLQYAGDTRPSNQDISNVQGASQLKERIAQTFEFAFGKGGYTRYNEEEMAIMVKVLSNHAKRVAKGYVEGFANTAPDFNYADPPEKIKRAFYGRMAFDPKEADQVQAAPKSKEDQQREELDKAIMENKKAVDQLKQKRGVK